jgi:CDGSH-type Zn-finger protein
MAGVDVRFINKGPIELKGSVELHDHDGHAVQKKAGDALYLCRCGASKSKPYCDGAHSAIAFDGKLA